MEGSEGSPGDVFDVDKVRQLVELMKAHDLTEVNLRQGAQRIRLRRGDANPPATLVASAPMHAVPQPAPVAPAPAAVAPVSSPPADDKNIVLIKSPMVGTFYTKSNPKAEPFVKVGDRVQNDTTVCIIEAMKMFNEIQAEVSGVIVAVLVENEVPVDHGKPLFKVDTSK